MELNEDLCCVSIDANLKSAVSSLLTEPRSGLSD